MNIYINEDNEKRLRELKRSGESMSGVINELLHAYFSEGGSPKENTPSPKNAEAENLERAGTGVASTVLPKDYDFCKHDQVKGFCKKGCK